MFKIKMKMTFFACLLVCSGLSADKTESWPSAFVKGTLIGVPLVAGAVVAVETCQNLGKEKECKDKGTGKVVLRKMSFADAFLESFKTLRKYCVPVGVGCCAASAALTAVFKYSKSRANESFSDFVGSGEESFSPQFKGANKSVLFSKSGSLGRFFFNDKYCQGFMDPVAAVFYIQEKDGKRRPLREIDLFNASLKERVELLNKARSRVTDETFWKLVCLESGPEHDLIQSVLTSGKPSQAAVKKLCHDGLPVGFRCGFYPANDLCVQNDKYTKSRPAFPGGGEGSFTVVSAHTIQELMAECPKAFDGSAVQLASRFSSFEMGFDLLKTMEPPLDYGAFKGFGSYEHGGVQGETLGLMLLPASTLRKYIEEPILAKLDDPRFKNGINLDHKASGCPARNPLEDVMIGFHRDSRVVFAKDNGPDDRPCAGNGIPALGLVEKDAFQINCTQLFSFAMCLRGLELSGNEDLFERAENLLKQQMLGTVKAAFLDGKKKVFLTGVGLGVFDSKCRSQKGWFVEAMDPVLDFARTKNMDIVLVDFFKGNKGVSDTAKRVLDTAERKGFTSSQRALTSLPDIKARFKDLKMMS